VSAAEGSLICKTCRGPKANYQCGVCQGHTCKSCAEFLSDESFAFLRNPSGDLLHSVYCAQCFDEKVKEPLEDYNEKLERAREVIVFTKDQTKETRLMKRTEKPYSVEECADEEEAIMKMSYYAIEDKFNALIDVKFTSRKIIVGSHKKNVWNASAIPLNIDPSTLKGDW
jgi:hypothetical protein